jgi:hypothetical protein
LTKNFYRIKFLIGVGTNLISNVAWMIGGYPVALKPVIIPALFFCAARPGKPIIHIFKT